jgi:NADPH:quinone reductase-like Zn-dependent oxidoreductase
VRFPEEGAWQSLANCRSDDVWFIPEDVPIDLAAMSHVNPPTAWRLLRDAYLQRGDWVIQNEATPPSACSSCRWRSI